MCLDTNILIWGILSNGKTPKEKEMINKTQAFLKEKFDEKCPLAISVISLAEFMVKIPNEDKNKYLEIFEQNFIILEFNKNTALKAAIF